MAYLESWNGTWLVDLGLMDKGLMMMMTTLRNSSITNENLIKCIVSMDAKQHDPRT